MDTVIVSAINHKEISNRFWGQDSAPLEAILPQIAPHYADQIGRIKNANRKVELLASGLLLARLLGLKSEGDFKVTESGCLTYPDGSRNFCLSHARDYTVLAYAEGNKPLGVDIEEISDRLEEKQVRLRYLTAKKVMPPDMLAQYQAASPAEEPTVFARLWTQVEAVLKAKGSGFYTDPLEEPTIFEEWQVCHEILDGHMICLATKEPAALKVTPIKLCDFLDYCQ